MRYSSAFRAKKRWRFIIPIFAALLVITGVLATQLPGIKPRLAWRVEIADAYLRGIINPVEQMPVPRTVQAAVDAATPTPRPTTCAWSGPSRASSCAAFTLYVSTRICSGSSPSW